MVPQYEKMFSTNKIFQLVCLFTLDIAPRVEYDLTCCPSLFFFRFLASQASEEVWLYYRRITYLKGSSGVQTTLSSVSFSHRNTLRGEGCGTGYFA
jgi:hypothetical protein